MEHVMIKRGLQLVGAFSLLAWTAVGAAAWMQVGEHVQVRISEGSEESGERDQLLVDRVATLSADLDALIAALESNLGQIAEAIAAEQTESAVEFALTRERLAALESALPSALQARETAGALSATLARLEALASVEHSSIPMAIEPPVRFDAAPESAPTEVPSAETAVEVAVATEPAAPVGEHKRSFLAFDLPSRDFHFDGRQRFEILGDLSRVGFDAKSTLHDFSGVSNDVSGAFSVDLAKPEDGISGSIAIHVESLSTGLDGRDEAMLEHLHSDEFDQIRFEPKSFVTARSDSSKLELEGTVLGRLTIHGVMREIEVPMQAKVDDSRRLMLEGEFPLLLSDYEVPVPNQLGVVSMKDEVRVWLRLRSRARAESVSH
jgi:polyisoprenoid-binding protein YceI